MTNQNKLSNHCSYPWQQMIIDLTGEVVPCCFWAGYGNTGKPLGNTNTNSIDEIWNGENYKDLRKRVFENDLDDHPCGNCMAYRWGNNTFPKFTWPGGFTHESGFCFYGQIDEKFEIAAKASGKKILLYEDDKPLKIPVGIFRRIGQAFGLVKAADNGNAVHEDIRKKGHGLFSVWKGWLYFSSSDNSDPMNNNRIYKLVCGDLVLELGGLVKNSKSGQNLLKAKREYNDGIVNIEAQPSMLSYISTSDCNIDCPACSQNMVRVLKVQHLKETTQNVLEKVPYLAQFIWHGGEPYLIKNFRSFVDDYKTEDNPNLSFGFTSNGVQITPKELEKLKKFPRINASISCDSFKRDTFDIIRAGASFDKVTKHIDNVMDIYSAPKRIFSVGMIVCKSNMSELAHNLQYTIDHNIPLNLSPVILYPASEHLAIFEDFDKQTKGWAEEIQKTKKILEKAKKENKVAIRRIDPTGMINEIEEIFEKAEIRYRETEELQVIIKDPFKRLRLCKNPTLIIYDIQNNPVAYRNLKSNQSDYILNIPVTHLDEDEHFSLQVLHNVMEPSGYVFIAKIYKHPSNGFYLIEQKNYTHVYTSKGFKITLGEFHPAKREKNIKWATYGDATPDGLNVTNIEDMHSIYREMYKDECEGITNQIEIIEED